MKNFGAFTLAEVLVTLGIIGVIAAVTVPGLKKHAEDEAILAQVKKAHSTVSNATQRIVAEKGPVRFWTSSRDNVTDLYKQYINNTPIAFSADEYSGVRKNIQGGAYTEEYSHGFMTSDGMLFYVMAFNSSCSNGSHCFNVDFDVNGIEPPNIVGVDIVAFGVYSDGSVKPSGASSDVCETASVGWECTAKMLRDNKISW